MKTSNKSRVIIGIIVFIVIIGAVAYIFRGQLFPSAPTNQLSNQSQVDTSSETYKQYAALVGEEYDRAFLANMIAHHQGAIDMAKLAQKNSKHLELKSMANDIISAQEEEIANMASWQQEWGYPSTTADNMMDHSAMGMMDTMASMTTELEGKSGDEFDKAFLQQMILHHQSAIDMAGPGEMNAQHQEVKDLANSIVVAQTKEIKQMESWQKEWGYDN